MDQKTGEAIALFRYSVIASVLHSDGAGVMEHFREMAAKTFDVPHYGSRQYEVATFKSWLRDFRKGGIDNLKPKVRSDKGKARVIAPELGQVIEEKRGLYPSLSCSALYKLLISEGHIDTNVVSEPTLRNFLNSHGLLRVREETQPRKKYERAHVNELWVADFMHGPHILIGRRKRKAFLCAIIDDYSRMVVGAEFFVNENTPALESTFKTAVLKHGIPQRLYCDNAKIFRSQHLQLVCARLQTALIHSKPYDPPSRGKVERWFRSVRERFLALLAPVEITSLDDLNSRLFKWIEDEYHSVHHHGIDTRPIDRWMADLKETEIRRICEHELDVIFLQKIKRWVKNDSTISILATLYEVPAKYIGEHIEIRFPTDKPDEVYLYEENRPVCRIRKVNPQENAQSPVAGIKFSDPEGEEGENQ
jgi:putative transposase